MGAGFACRIRRVPKRTHAVGFARGFLYVHSRLGPPSSYYSWPATSGFEFGARGAGAGKQRCPDCSKLKAAQHRWSDQTRHRHEVRPVGDGDVQRVAAGT